MKRISLFIPEPMLHSLNKLSDKTGAPVAELIRRAVERLLDERKSELREKTK
jgi:metal-responsive CopG/Arc/MetJ family transcriptional regulator